MNTEPTLILLVDDNTGDARLLKELLRETDKPFVMIHAETLTEAVTRLKSERFDVMFLDLSLPDASGLDTVTRACSEEHETPIIVMTGMDDETLGLKAVQAGAQDYLIKGTVEGSTLWRTIRYAMERHRMARELERSQREQLAMKDQFLSHLSHELRSPLTTVHQFLSILTDGLAGDLNAEQREYLEIVERNVHQLRTMISDLLDVTRVGSGKLTVQPQCTSIIAIIAETLQSLQATAAEKDIKLLRDDVSWAPPVYADPDRVRQIMTNLVENALKFTPAGGTIVLRASVPNPGSSFVCISVADTGIGISEEGAQRIFDRLYQELNSIETSRKGLGIGLYLCKELVARHGGQIWVESKLGVGSTFTFTLPTASPVELLKPLLSTPSAHPDRIGIVRVALDAVPPAESLSEAARRQSVMVIENILEQGRDMLLPRVSAWRDREELYILSQGSLCEIDDLILACHLMARDRQDLIEMGVTISAQSEWMEMAGAPGSLDAWASDVATEIMDHIGRNAGRRAMEAGAS
jgi:signal transduction histidine kinase